MNTLLGGITTAPLPSGTYRTASAGLTRPVNSLGLAEADPGPESLANAVPDYRQRAVHDQRRWRASSCLRTVSPRR